MKIKILAITVLVVVAIGAYFLFKKPADSTKFVEFDGDAVITMGEDSYSPQNIRIKVGSKVTFVNSAGVARWPASDLHPSHLIYSQFDPRAQVANGANWEFVFSQAGEWGYHDHLAPYITGTIDVVE